MNIVLKVNYTSKACKQTDPQKKRSYLWLPEVRGGRRGNWMKAIKRYKLPVIKSIKY